MNTLKDLWAATVQKKSCFSRWIRKYLGIHNGITWRPLLISWQWVVRMYVFLLIPLLSENVTYSPTHFVLLFVILGLITIPMTFLSYVLWYRLWAPLIEIWQRVKYEMKNAR